MMLKIRRRRSATRFGEVERIVVSVLLTFAIFGVVFWQAGVNPLLGYQTILLSAFGSKPNLFETIARTFTFTLLALAFILPQKAGLWNIGAQGQLYMGMIAATGISYLMPNLSSSLLLPLMALASILFGAMWALIPALLKAEYDVTEVVTTLFFSTIAILIVNFLVVRGPWMSEAGRPESRPIPVNGMQPMIAGTTIPYTVVLLIPVVAIVTFLILKTTIGYQVRTLGANPSAARYAGVDQRRIVLLTMLIAGMLAGFAGFNHVSSAAGVLQSTVAANWGYYALVFALFAGSNPAASVVSVFLLTGFLIGTQILESEFGVGYGLQYLFIGILILSWLVSHVNQYEIVRSDLR